jgi:hypothetical protein
MKTINKDIDIFYNEELATKAFNRSLAPCELLYSDSTKSWYIDRSFTALKEWPKLYKLINTKSNPPS